ncbi:MAG: hypothetical protein DMG57_41415 [Acidobacteria bacterium]|nr:MAG: hypothetical protein DMG57_41415 [Acidobacteriota bacterium]
MGRSRIRHRPSSGWARSPIHRRLNFAEERGKLKVDDPVKKYLPDTPAAWDKVTVFHPLTHTSGIPSFTSFPDYQAAEAIPSPAEKTVARFRDKPLDF